MTFSTEMVWQPDGVILYVQCYAWTEYKFACVCVCARVSVTLSVNSPTRQTSPRIFTAVSLKDADIYARMCLLGVSMMNNYI